ncbi:hypothetical protein [Mesorhizobium sp. A623]
MSTDYRDRYQTIADYANQAVERKFPWWKAGKVDGEQIRHAHDEAKEFILAQGGNPDRSSHFDDCKVKMYPPEYGGKVYLELSVPGRGAVSVRGSAQSNLVPGTEQRLQKELNPMDRKWLTVEIGENLKRGQELKGERCQPQSTWTRIDLEIHRRESFEAAKAQAVEERKAQTARPGPPAFLFSRQPEREVMK